MNEEVTVAGIRVKVANPESAVQEIFCSVRKEASSFHLANAYTVALASKNSGYLDVLLRGKVFPDGKPLSLILKLRNNLALQIRGPSLFENCLGSEEQGDVRHFFLGSTENVLNKILAKIDEEYKDVQVAGIFSPPFAPTNVNTTQEQDQLILKSGANLIWVGLGTPKQDFEAERISRELGITCVAIGAAFDFFSGSKPECPAWIRSVGLEWMFRLFSEPKRLWKRYLIGNFLFLWTVIRKGIK